MPLFCNLPNFGRLSCFLCSRIQNKHAMKESQSKLPVMHFEVPEEEVPFMTASVPNLLDGLTTVQRRILFALYADSDGSWIKADRITGLTMLYEPGNWKRIVETLYTLGKKGFIIEYMGGWDAMFPVEVGDAYRYCEGRMTRFAKDIIYFTDVSSWIDTYDGLNLEPTELPVLFPLLLAQGVEGTTECIRHQILPHNFNDLVDASIAVLKDEPFELYPDFSTGGFADCSYYDQGRLGGAVIVRAKIEKLDKNTLIIKELPYGQTVEKIVESLKKAKKYGLVKFLSIEVSDENPEEPILHLSKYMSANRTIEDLYKHTDCKVILRPNACVIKDGNPVLISVDSILRHNVERTKILLGKHLESMLKNLQDQLFSKTLDRIFFSKKVYLILGETSNGSWEEMKNAVFSKVCEFQEELNRPVLMDDIEKLLQKPVQKMAGVEGKKYDERIVELEKQMEEVRHDIQNLNAYTINWFETLKKKYGEKYPRRTEITARQIKEEKQAESNQ